MSRGAPARATQELAGHSDLSMTQRYMHASPAAVEGAIRLLDRPSGEYGRGEIVETRLRGVPLRRAGGRTGSPTEAASEASGSEGWR
jgi:hypothetical protein